MGNDVVSHTSAWRRMTTGVSVLVVMALMMVVPADAAERRPLDTTTGAEATFEGAFIDLSKDWGEASACLIWDEVGVRECFRTEAELQARVDELEGKAEPVAGENYARSATCSSSLRLYDGVVYTGKVMYFRDRQEWINLSDYGFANKTSSFKIGACSALFADYSWGGGARYPSSDTQAWDKASVMATGWGNRVSSIFIY